MNQIIIALAIAAAGFGAGWQTNGWRLNEKIAEAKAEQLQTDKKALADMTEERDQKADKLSTIDQTYTSQLTKARNETKRLNSCIADGTCGLRIHATIPACTTETTQGGSVDSGTSATLAPSAQRAYSALLDGINTTEITLAACQESLGVFVKEPR